MINPLLRQIVTAQNSTLFNYHLWRGGCLPAFYVYTKENEILKEEADFFFFLSVLRFLALCRLVKDTKNNSVKKFQNSY